MRYRYFTNAIMLAIFINPFSGDIQDCSAPENSSPAKYTNQVRDEKIRTILLYRERSALTLPVINLNSGERLELHFDDLSEQQRNFSYTLIHCNSRWESSLLEQQEYLGGFGSGRIDKTASSFNTTYGYFHYNLMFPGDEARPLISGNYALVVYQDNDPENIVLIRQFYVTEPLVTIEAEVRQPAGEKNFTGQEIEFKMHYEGHYILDPARDITILIRQNGNSGTDKIITKPRFVGPAELVYGGNNTLVFDGGNEFRYFDIKSMKYEAEHIGHIDFQNPYYHVFLKPDEPRTYDPYFTQKEFNGNYYIDKENSQDRHVEADYVYVHFQMPAQIPYTDGEIYIYGALSGWSDGIEYRMSYNAEKRRYENILLLKQGLYNYAYAYCQSDTRVLDISYFEGNHYETENEYTFFVYHYDSSWDYDRLIAVKQISSR
ncbi:MAG: DUF5103 domain-containing protein [Bacteroidales bacterium]|nr:DUF5103 domain-containing protein [Bacteroidales bacterium]